MHKISDNPMEPSILIHFRAKNKGSRQNRVKGKFVGRDRLWKVANHGRLVGEFVLDDFVYIGRQQEDISRFQVRWVVRPADNDYRRCA